jgi:hypothetical protein
MHGLLAVTWERDWNQNVPHAWRYSAIYPALLNSTHVLLLNRPSTLGYSNTQHSSYSRVTFAGVKVVRERHFAFRLGTFSAPRSSTSLLRVVHDFVNEVRHNLTIQRYLLIYR